MNFKKRGIATSIILSFVTCGIYFIIWIVQLISEVIKFRDQNDDGLLEILLSIFVLPVGIYLAEQKFAEGCRAYGIPHDDRTVVYLLLSLFGLGIVAIALMQEEANKIHDMYYPTQQPQW